MISVVIATLDDAPALARTLAPLVPAAVDGLVREVILADGGSADATLEIAEEAGARVVRCDGSPAARAGQACAAARADWLMILQVGAVLPPAWTQAAAAHLNGGSGRAAVWAAPALWPWRGAPRAVLAPRRLCRAQAAAGEALVRRLAARAARLGIAG